MPEKVYTEEEKKEIVRDILGDSLKVFYDTHPWNRANVAYFGEKYKDPATRKLNVDGGYSTDRQGAISVALYALAAQNKYTLEQLIDNDLLKEEKAEMFDKTMTYMKNPRDPESQKWIAEQIYMGRDVVRKMIDDESKTIDFSDPNIMQDKKFCMLLHLAYHEHDAAQEAEHCRDEIGKLAKMDGGDYIDQWKGSLSPLYEINENIERQENDAINLMTKEKDNHSELTSLLTHINAPRIILSKLVEMKKTKKDIPFHKWIEKQDRQGLESIEIFVNLMFSVELNDFFSAPKACRGLAKPAVDGIITKNANIKYDFETKSASVEGLPSTKVLKALSKAGGVYDRVTQDFAKKKAEELYNDVKSVNFNLMGKGSQEFDDMKNALKAMHAYANVRGKGATAFDPNVYLKKQQAALKCVEDYIRHKRKQIREDPSRIDDEKKQRREQPRINAAVNILSKLELEIAYTEHALSVKGLKKVSQDSKTQQNDFDLFKSIDDAVTLNTQLEETMYSDKTIARIKEKDGRTIISKRPRKAPEATTQQKPANKPAEKKAGPSIS